MIFKKIRETLKERLRLKWFEAPYRNAFIIYLVDIFAELGFFIMLLPFLNGKNADDFWWANFPLQILFALIIYLLQNGSHISNSLTLYFLSFWFLQIRGLDESHVSYDIFKIVFPILACIGCAYFIKYSIYHNHEIYFYHNKCKIIRELWIYFFFFQTATFLVAPWLFISETLGYGYFVVYELVGLVSSIVRCEVLSCSENKTF